MPRSHEVDGFSAPTGPETRLDLLVHCQAANNLSVEWRCSQATAPGEVGTDPGSTADTPAAGTSPWRLRQGLSHAWRRLTCGRCRWMPVTPSTSPATTWSTRSRASPGGGRYRLPP